ncbi:MAG: hypothetical protein U0974_01350 [Gemmatimonadales bacterium]|nr:hypothetical protein [Gemmatimonadales bacterium]MDZ4388362.1 hypothetical protein [Gemmatimonadales bacterium]
MRRHHLLLLALLLAPAAAQAQTLTSGVWRGVLSLPEAPVLVTVVAARPEGKLTLEIRPEGAPSYGLGGIREERHRVRFRWALGGGTEFECLLSGRDDGRFEGFCDDIRRGADGTLLKVPLSLFPPLDPAR